MRNHEVYHLWVFMRRNAKAQGLSVQPEWSDFRAFLADLGERPAGAKLTRKNKYRGYTKENMQWQTANSQW